MDLSAEFKRWKAQCLSKVDLSRKGSVDEDVLEIVQLLNGQEQFFTTSSCAGRIILLDGSINGSEVQKQNCSWLLVTHKACVKDDVIIFVAGKIAASNPSRKRFTFKIHALFPKDSESSCLVVALRRADGDAILKFEPLVLHVQCRQLQDARILHSVAIDSGFRNSGITVGKRGKIMLAVRSTHGLEVPLSHQGKLMVTEEYIDFLLKIANQKMEENKKRIERFYNCLQHALEKETVSATSHPKEKVNSPYIRKKKRNPDKAHGKHVTEENDKELENNDHDDPGISVTIFPEDY
ncbi:tRNA wybutosine-synthesizing protein 3 homolog isoform X1 [Muntiacus reevesi]|uniref:tRNA wybutosine-synthesizing protein 3 homolog isoform X1 n=1 Tax=Muntiacus reevesi TaxID=9886 RepID=UPI003306CDB5